jgi:hypothetical protein
MPRLIRNAPLAGAFFQRAQQAEEDTMKKLALRIAAAAALLTAAPAMAQVEFYAGCGPYTYPCGGCLDDYSGPNVAIGGGHWHHHHWHHFH